nr:hypothetical protein [Tanacetum cinerariifolium]
VSKEVDEIVTDAVDWAIQAPLWNRFRDLPEADMKEILHQRKWETNSYQANEDHKNLYEALEKSIARNQTDQFLTNLDEARRKKKMRHDSPKTLPGSLFEFTDALYQNRVCGALRIWSEVRLITGVVIGGIAEVSCWIVMDTIDSASVSAVVFSFSASEGLSLKN